MTYYQDEGRRKLNDLLSSGAISSDGRLNGQFNLTLASLLQADNSEPGVKFAQPFHQGEMDRNREQFAREDVRAMERGFNPQQFQSPQPAPQAPQAPEPQNYFQRSGGPRISLDQFAGKRQHDVFVDGPLELGRQRTPDGGEMIIKRIPTTDSFGRQSAQVVQEFVPPVNLDSMKKSLEIQRMQQEINQPIPGEKPPAGYRFTPAGDLVPIAGGPADPRNQADKPLNEFQGKSAGFGARAAAAHEIINSIGNDGAVQPGLIKRAAEAVPFAGDALGTMTNWTQSAPQQQIEQAQRDFINAVLRQESGAAIADTEFDNARKQYFPQPGDTQQAVLQKARNRDQVIKSFSTNAGAGSKHVDSARASAQTIFEAHKAIKQGAPREAVRARLEQMGITNSGI